MSDHQHDFHSSLAQPTHPASSARDELKSCSAIPSEFSELASGLEGLDTRDTIVALNFGLPLETRKRMTLPSFLSSFQQSKSHQMHSAYLPGIYA
jgi:hypothetical protein